MPYTFNPFTGNFDNTPSTNKGDGAYTTLLSNSADFSTYNYVNSKFLPLSGGTVTGKVFLHDNLTVYGTISATGNSYFANTVYSTTSALSVINLGNNGPALYISNNGTGDLASFYDYDTNVEVFHIGGVNGSFPNVGVKTSTPNVDFTVNGQISSNNIIFARDGNSNDWNSNYTLVQSKSANWDIDIDTGVRSLTGDYAVKSELVKYLPLSGGTVTGNVYLLSALEIGTGVDTLIVRNNFITANASISSNNIIFAKDGNSDNWNSNYSLVQGKSSSWDSAFGSAGADLLVRSITGGWVGGNSAFITLCSLSGNLNSVYSTVSTNSANWNFTYRNITNYLPLSGGTVTGIVNFLTSIDIKGVTNINNDLYVLSSILINNNSSEISTLFVTNSTVGINTETPNVAFTVNGQISSNNTIFSNNGNSNLWNSVYTNVNITSAFWDSSRTYVNSNSSNFILDGGNTKGSNISIGTNDNFNLALETNNTSRITILNSGNIGIGTTTPNEKLTVVGNISAVGTHVFEVSSTSPALRITQTGTGDAIVVEDSTNPDSTPFVVNQNGQLIMGSLSAWSGATLQIISPSESNAAIHIKNNANNGTPSVLRFFKGRGTHSVPLEVLAEDQIGNIAFHPLLSNDIQSSAQPRGANIRSHVDGNPVPSLSSIPTRFSFWTNTSGANVATEKMRITHDGKVGIGTTTPNELLTVVGNISASESITANTLQASIKNFVIKHPIDDSKSLQYSSIESPYIGIRLTGEDEVINGECVVNLPAYIKGLIHKEDVHILLTNYKHSNIIFVDDIDIENNTFTVKSENCIADKEYKFFWSLTGVRKDVPNLQVEI